MRTQEQTKAYERLKDVLPIHPKDSLRYSILILWPYLYSAQGQGKAEQEAAAGHRHQVHQAVGEHHQATRRRQSLIP